MSREWWIVQAVLCCIVGTMCAFAEPARLPSVMGFFVASLNALVVANNKTKNHE